MKFEEIEGDLISLAKEGKFDLITHCCNCQNLMGAGIAPQMAKEFGCNNYYLEGSRFKGDFNKLGQIDFIETFVKNKNEEAMVYKVDENYKSLFVINSYGQ